MMKKVIRSIGLVSLTLNQSFWLIFFQLLVFVIQVFIQSLLIFKVRLQTPYLSFKLLDRFKKRCISIDLGQIKV